jgi:hypothetical protein
MASCAPPGSLIQTGIPRLFNGDTVIRDKSQIQSHAGRASSNWLQVLSEVHAKLLTTNRGEMAEWLKAAVC